MNVDEHDPEDCQGFVNKAVSCPQPRFEATGAAVIFFVLKGQK